MNFKLPDHADGRKESADAKRALLAKLQTGGKPAHAAKKSAK